MIDSGILMGIVVVVLATIILITLIIQVTGAWRARGQVAQDSAYRELAETTAAAQADAREALERQGAELSEIKERLIAIEKLLRDVG